MWRHPHTSRSNRAVAITRAPLVLGVIVFVARWPQDVASRPSTDRNDDSLVVSVSSGAHGKLEKGDRAVSANATQDSGTPRSTTMLTHCNDDVTYQCKAAVQVLVKRFIGFGSDNAWSVDFLLVVVWQDKRTSSVIPLPDKMPFITMTKAEANKKIWLPEILVMNRDIGKSPQYDTITWEVKVWPTGECRIYHRMVAKIRQGFDYTAYPFDHKYFKLVLGDTSQFANEMDISIHPSMIEGSDTKSGLQAVRPHDFAHTPYILLDWHMNTSVDNDHGMRANEFGWSRLTLTMHAKRDPDKVIETSMMPDMCMVGVCWLVFFYPRLPNFTMAKAASLMIALLALLRSRVGTNSRLPPGRSGTCWLEAFEDTCLNAVVFSLSLNVFGEMVYTQWDDPALAERMSHAMKFVFPLMVSSMLLVCWFYAAASTQREIKNMQDLNLLIASATAIGWVMYFKDRGKSADIEEEPAVEGASPPGKTVDEKPEQKEDPAPEREESVRKSDASSTLTASTVNAPKK